MSIKRAFAAVASAVSAVFKGGVEAAKPAAVFIGRIERPVNETLISETLDKPEPIEPADENVKYFTHYNKDTGYYQTFRYNVVTLEVSKLLFSELSEEVRTQLIGLFNNQTDDVSVLEQKDAILILVNGRAIGFSSSDGDKIWVHYEYARDVMPMVKSHLG